MPRDYVANDDRNVAGAPRGVPPSLCPQLKEGPGDLRVNFVFPLERWREECVLAGGGLFGAGSLRCKVNGVHVTMESILVFDALVFLRVFPGGFLQVPACTCNARPLDKPLSEAVSSGPQKKACGGGAATDAGH